MTATKTKKIDPAKPVVQRAGLSALLKDDDAQEVANETPVFESNDEPATEKKKNVWFVGTEEEKQKKESSDKVRVTLKMINEIHTKVKIMASWEFTTLQEIINTSLQKTIAEYEKEHGELKKVPKSERKK